MTVLLSRFSSFLRKGAEAENSYPIQPTAIFTVKVASIWSDW
jgi:hypothetical protein